MLNWIESIDHYFSIVIEASTYLKDLFTKWLIKNLEYRIWHENIQELKTYEWSKEIDWNKLEMEEIKPLIKPDIVGKSYLQNLS